ncbi:Protein-lysine N-methyltransferase Efm [Trema orientale]|uniref:Protein-lysine N-methyltransferase TorRG33x02_217750 n=1 Tax=Trema orientale TaxID=63057 RepID=A0A2P5EA22_TREOI|nr:Protein-lysine N-methyltransferase Efm [Trema orientale]
MEDEVELPTNPNSLKNHTNLPVDEDDDDPPALSSQAMAALREFLAEQSQSAAEPSNGNEGRSDSSVALVAEDWRLSQFWYDPETAETLAREVLTLCQLGSSNSDSGSPLVACIACPTLYAYLKNNDSDMRVQLLEYDKRFEQYGSEFTFYDYNQPGELPLELKHAFDVVVADPPYLSKECLEKVADTISYLTRSSESSLLLLTGAVQKDRAAELMGLQPCGFRPRHSSKLGNEFRLFTNYDPGMRLGGWEQEK